ncbi:hypothetical protein [Metabacillus sp. Hm71]|uniref:hypothetical protein n=1 Tax=Metabacillus sp. Hm71 TaxID=3450743 RepID=UPI003F42D817
MTTRYNLILRNKVYVVDFARPKESNEALLDFFSDVQKIDNNIECLDQIITKMRGRNVVDHDIVQLAKTYEKNLEERLNFID